jgi:hypothetical protein
VFRKFRVSLCTLRRFISAFPELRFWGTVEHSPQSVDVLLVLVSSWRQAGCKVYFRQRRTKETKGCLYVVVICLKQDGFDEQRDAQIEGATCNDYDLAVPGEQPSSKPSRAIKGTFGTANLGCS